MLNLVHSLAVALVLSVTASACDDTSGGGASEGGVPSRDAGAVPDAAAPDGGGRMPGAITQCGDGLCVFPGADGFGARTIAGRGGRVLRVTTLADDGDGSLRAALSAGGPRVVVFDVSGTIELSSKITVRDPFVTIAGQTAPSPGITVSGRTITLRTHDVLIQHVRFRAGAEAGGDADTLNVLGPALAGDEVHSIVIDHCSFSWGIDETLSFNYEPRDITVSASLVSESLSNAGHSEGEHSKGILFGNASERVSLVRSVAAHNVDRNPFIKGGTTAVVVNNVFYDWARPYGARLGSSDSAELPITANLIGNVYIAGPSSPANGHAVAVHQSVHPDTRLYVADTLAQGVAPYLNEAGFDPLADEPVLEVPVHELLAAADVQAAVLADAGARPRDRDAVDARVIEQVVARTGGIIDHEGDVGGLPALAENRRVFDVGDDPSGDDDGNGYTNLEERLHAAARAVQR